ncbi:MAG: hypothetical protein MUC56_04745 [Thermoanaerobaculales bacterium]|jgi:hypothetical protein|nr:hypothetical protein [Thermoanaerobaculales bacterium]
MAMESVLKQLESKIEELVAAYRDAVDRAAEGETRIAELEAKLAGTSEVKDRLAELETQRDALAARLEKVLGLIDGVLGEK